MEAESRVSAPSGVLDARIPPGEPELEAEDRVDEHRREEHDPHRPEQRRLDPEELGVAVQPRPALEGLQVAEHVAEDEREQDEPRRGHEGFLPDDAAPEGAEPRDAR